MLRLIRSEILKISRQPGLFAAGFLAVPAFALLVKILMQLVVYRRLGRSDLPQEVDFFREAAQSFSVSGNALAHLFFALGVASVFVVEYCFATWRHLVPRRSRFELWLAKFLTAGLCLSVSLLLMVLGSAALTSLIALADGVALSQFFAAGSLVLFGLAFLAAMLELLVLAALTAFLTVLLRSSMAAVIIAFLTTLATVLLQAYLGPADELWWLPSEAASQMRAALFSVTGEGFWVSAAILVGWLSVAGGLGLATFVRQELATE